MRVGLVLGAGGVLGGAWLTGGLSALAKETDWDPGSSEFIVGTSAGSMIGALVAAGVPPWFMVAHSRGDVFDGLTAERTVADQLRKPEIRARLAGLPNGEPHKVTRPAGPPSSWPEMRPAVRRAA